MIWLDDPLCWDYSTRFDPYAPNFSLGVGFTPTKRQNDTMIEALKSDEIVNKMGGRFKLTALIQKRLKELLIDGARPLVEREGRTDLEIVIEEIMQDKITADFSETHYITPAERLKAKSS